MSIVKDLDRMIAMKKEHTELYELGMISPAYGIIHVREELLLQIPGEIQTQTRDCEKYPFEHSKIYGNEKFFALSTEESL